MPLRAAPPPPSATTSTVVCMRDLMTSKGIIAHQYDSPAMPPPAITAMVDAFLPSGVSARDMTSYAPKYTAPPGTSLRRVADPP
eukprot:CAMPEP_0170190806 /NCGR_PEP_ID=MMETSP0040_2-20121228/50181_1 /TAXON_ID=641309 /ORGANISM="Lotharella oceanica, Strain CCMP622" /LENGTH=83 /DNA_ID=CAMNT_0010438745 /DNA_START=130 /DNA_END=378 /DNA_ORIENTATION=-